MRAQIGKFTGWQRLVRRPHSGDAVSHEYKSHAFESADGSLVATLLFAMIFVFGWRLHRTRTPRAVLSAGAGATTSYVFVRMLPELGEAQTAFLAASAGRALPAPELRVYTAALLGFVMFYGLENLVAWSRERAGTASGRDWSRPLFLLHVGGFALYTWLITYLMVRGISDTPLPIALYATAMGLHFIGVDHSLQREHGAAYLRVGRFVLAGAALAGWSTASMTEISRMTIITSLALISGGVVMNSMVMELPTEKMAALGRSSQAPRHIRACCP